MALKRIATARISYISFDYDIDEGWYLDVTIEVDGRNLDLGPDPETEPGFRTIDDAFTAIQGWALQRGLIAHIPLIEVAITKESP